ncbi:MAG TPA: hypothetical protein VJ898_15125 [Natrialbaceae archaeon]|nr:hypothetical protein [Natrialbaceae archaeon]
MRSRPFALLEVFVAFAGVVALFWIVAGISIFDPDAGVLGGWPVVAYALLLVAVPASLALAGRDRETYGLTVSPPGYHRRVIAVGLLPVVALGSIRGMTANRPRRNADSTGTNASAVVFGIVPSASPAAFQWVIICSGTSGAARTLARPASTTNPAASPNRCPVFMQLKGCSK